MCDFVTLCKVIHNSVLCVFVLIKVFDYSLPIKIFALIVIISLTSKS